MLDRAAYGAALVLLPGPVIWLATGQRPGRRARRVAVVLGIRHLIQAALTAAAPEPPVLATGGQVDAVHAASMLLLAAVSRGGRRAAVTDALTEAAFAAASWSASYPGQPRSLGLSWPATPRPRPAGRPTPGSAGPATRRTPRPR